MIRFNEILICMMMLFSFYSCTESLPVDPGSGSEEGGLVDLLFSVNASDPQVVETKGSTSPQNEIQSVDALVFDENKRFMSREKVDVISYSEGVFKFKIQLAETSARRYIHLIANARDNAGDRIDFASLQPNADENILGALRIKPLTTGSVASIFPHVMWGKINLSSVQNGTKIPLVKLIRTTASVNLEVAENVLTGPAQFQLQSISVYNASSSGLVTPLDFSASDRVPDQINLPEPNPVIPYFTPDGNGYWVQAVGNACRDLYIYEAYGEMEVILPARSWNGDGGISVIVKATYEGEQCYYKIVPKKNRIPIAFIRNHRYILRIINVKGKGYASINDALANAPANLEVMVYDRTERFVNMVVGGNHKLGLTLTELYLYTNTLENSRLFDILVSDDQTTAQLNILNTDVAQKLQLQTAMASEGYTNELSVTGTTQSPFNARAETRISVANQYGTLRLNIPLVIDPEKQITTGGRLMLVAPGSLKDWNLKLQTSASFANRLIVYKNNTIQSGLSLKGNENDSVELQSLPGSGINPAQYVYASLDGITLSGEVFHRLYIIKCN